jgi:multicomponent Na+:H+ antiporter subunit B
MKKTLLHLALPYMRFILIFFSVLTLLRGHNYPGGGFIGGLMASGAFIFDALVRNVQTSRKSLRIDPAQLIGIGLLTAFVSVLPGIFTGKPFFTGIWVSVPLPAGLYFKIGTPLIFDIGVYFTVAGVALLFIYTLMEEWQWK